MDQKNTGSQPSAPILCAAALFEPALPAAWGPTLDLLADIEELQDATKGSREEREARGRDLHDRLMRGIDALSEPTPDEFHAASASFRAWFTEAVLLWLRFAGSSSAPLIDTVASRPLLDFPLDLPEGSEGIPRVRRALREALAWDEAELAQVEAAMDHMTSNLAVKHAITKAIASQLAAKGGASPAACAELMSAIYGPLPWRPGDVDLLMTSTAIFLCLRASAPATGSPGAEGSGEAPRLEVPGWDERPEEERRAISAFIARCDDTNTAATARFPAFGYFDRAAIDPALARSLADAAAVPTEVVTQTLATMVMVLRTPEVEDYVVHDAWGHAWQEALAEFEWEYAVLPRIEEPLALDTVFPGAVGPGIASAFVERGGRTELDEAALLRFAEADIRARLQVAASNGIAEMLADFMESKYAWHRPSLKLPDASLLPITGLKLDLTVGDVRRQVARWSKPYRALAEDEGARARLVDALSPRVPAAGLKEAVDQAGALLWREFATAFDDTLRPVAAKGGGIRASACRRMVLQLAQVAAVLERTLAASCAGGPRSGSRSGPRTELAWRDPALCVDLLLVTIARFYEHERQRNFWHLDQILSTGFVDACGRLRAAMANAESP
ncbi:hypothetical protein ACSRUE_00440 [Sorangium sp. KYC3313]|uniref:hypothetical protein n=1 Tax=Sorangium sp. KYC3313 TaxID=3449740 RepID=UPI003F89A690